MTLIVPAGEIEFRLDEDGYWNGRVDVWGDIDYVLGNIPAAKSEYKDTFGDTGKPWDDTTLREAVFRESPNGKRGILTLQYSDAPAASTGQGNPGREKADNTPEYAIRESGLEKSVQEHPDYLTRWDHHLVVETGHGGAFAGWDSATDLEIPGGYEDKNIWVHWSESWERVDSDGLEWKILHSALKPGVTSFIVSGPQVVERRWFSSKSAAESFLAGVRRGTKVTPGETFGVADGEWLVWDSSLDPDGRRWEGMIIYQWADEWDSDLYG